MNVFLSTPSARRATPAALAASCKISISIHALREEGDLLGRVFFLVASKFLSTPSARRATFDSIDYISNQEFLSTPSARRATGIVKADAIVIIISIHALREEGDRCHANDCRLVDAISIHALREEGDVNNVSVFCGIVDFYPRPPRGGRRHKLGREQAFRRFLSTPSARRATGRQRAQGVTKVFLSTPSARRATVMYPA